MAALLSQPVLTWALEPEQIDEHLSQEIIGPQLSMSEVQTYTEDRVVRIPEIKTKEEWETFQQSTREAVFEKVIFRGAAVDWRNAETKVEWLDTLEGGPGYSIKKLRYEAIPGLWIPALLYEPVKLQGKAPVMLNVNGHDGKNGKAAPYKQMRCINQAKRGIVALNVEWVGMGQLRSTGSHYAMNQIDLCGTGGVAVHYLAMKRALDILLSHENADQTRVGVAGLSGGGWQTIFFSSLETRVTLANPVAGYSSFLTRARHLKDLGDSEQTPSDLAGVADYKHLTAMLAPRAALLTFNQEDQCCFAAPYALPPLMEAAKPIYDLYDKSERLRSHVNTDPGTHNFERDNREALYRMFRDFFLPDGDPTDGKEIASQGELKTYDELSIPLPEDNQTFNGIALALAKELPHDADLPDEKGAILKWQQSQRKRLADLVRYHAWESSAKTASQVTQNGVTVKQLRIKIGDSWTVPAVEFSPAKAPKHTVILVHDSGRSAAQEQVAALLKQGKRVVAIDPFYLGESKIADKDFLFALLVASVGERPLGIQASQLASVARLVKQQNPQTSVTLSAVGPRSSTFALIAAGIETDAIAGVEVSGAYGSLREVVEQNKVVTEMPEMFCFGLLQSFDIAQISALSAPRPVTFAQPSGRVKKELTPLANIYQQLGVKHDPLGSN